MIRGIGVAMPVYMVSRVPLAMWSGGPLAVPLEALSRLLRTFSASENRNMSWDDSNTPLDAVTTRT